VLIVRAPDAARRSSRAPGLRAAVRHGAGLDMIPIEAATAAGVLVANVPGANASTVAEHAIFAAIALLRRFRMDATCAARLGGGARTADTNRDLSGGRWASSASAISGRRCTGWRRGSA
jgi:D-3-phosphoglycerate dehydrogenase / 2-oxoglutarate reductase